jgi:hypothetical protein
MKAIASYNITQENWMIYNSKLCSVACSIGYKNQKSELNDRINELVQSFFNQWQFVMVTYDKLHQLFTSLNENSDVHNSENILSKYDIQSTESEFDFKNYSYLLILNIKTYLDLFSCLVDIIINQTIREETKLPDFYSFGQSKKDKKIIEIIIEFNNLRDENKYPWIALLKNIRNRIMHRGYQLKPKFGFVKSEELNIQTFKGVDFYSDVINIEIGKLFDSFMTDIPIIEERISNILIGNIDELNGRILINASFKFDGLINMYSYKETDSIVL